MNRRNFLSALGASVAAMCLGTLPKAKAGVLGVTYFKAPHCPKGMHLFLNGRDVHCEANECDLVQGWVQLWEVAERNTDGTVKTFANDGWQTISRRRYGKVEWRPYEEYTDTRYFVKSAEVTKLDCGTNSAEITITYILHEGKWITDREYQIRKATGTL